MTVKTGQAWAGLFVTLDATGALSAGTPAGVLYVDGVANGASVTITGSNPYKWSVTLPALTAGQRVDMYITATISTIATASVVASEQADTTILSDGVAVASIANNAITAAAIAQYAIDADSIKDDAVTKIQTGLATPTNITAASGVTLGATQGAITWGQQKIEANVSDQGALDIYNSNASGYGQRNRGGTRGLMNYAGSNGGYGLFNYSFNTNGIGQVNQAFAASGIGLKNIGPTKNVDGFDPAQALEETLTAIKGAGWSDETLAAIDALIDAIKAKTDQLAFTVANQVDANALTGGGGDSASVVADAVWDEAMAGHVGAGTLGKAVADILEDSGTTIPNDLVDIENKIDVIATDTTTEIPASITALDGKIDTIDNYIDTEVAAIKAKTDNLPANPAAVGSAMTLTAAYDKAKDDVLTPLATVDGIVDAIKAKTDNLPSDPADDSDLDTSIAAVKSVVDAVKVKTDNLPASPAAVGSAMTLANNAITAAVIATDAIDADAIATDAVTKIQAGLATAAAIATMRGADSDTLKTLSDQIDVIGGSGSIAWDYTVTDGTNPVPACNVWVSTDAAGANVIASGITNSAGIVTFRLNPGTVYVWKYKLGYNGDNPDREVVS